MPAPRKISHRQIEILINFMEVNGKILKGRLSLCSGPVGAMCVQLWDDVAAQLNSDADGCSKSAREWKNYWNNLKYKVRTKVTQRVKDLSTSEDVFQEIECLYLSKEERRILHIIDYETGLKQQLLGSHASIEEPENIETAEKNSDHIKIEHTDAKVSHTNGVESDETLNDSVEGPSEPTLPTIRYVHERYSSEERIRPSPESDEGDTTEKRPCHCDRCTHVPEWARKMEERHLAAQERMARTMQSLLDNQREILRVLRERLPLPKEPKTDT